MIRIRPWRLLDTKVTIKQMLQNESSREYLLESKDYKGTLQIEPVVFRDEVLNWDLELGYRGNPYRDG